jgi:hypothetical protein
MGSSSNVSGVLGSGEPTVSSSSGLAKTSPGILSSSSGTMFVLRGSSMSGRCRPCSVLARLRESGLLGAESIRVKDREGWRFLGRCDMVGGVARPVYRFQVSCAAVASRRYLRPASCGAGDAELACAGG